MQQFRQGDVMVRRIKSLPKAAQDVTPKGRIVLAHGEVTGHAHAIAEGQAREFSMVERYGAARYLLDSGAHLVHRDEVGLLYRKDVTDDEPIVMVRVLNSTPEPDGVMSRDEAIATFGDAARYAVESPEGSRFKAYMIRVPPDVRTAREAVAWTFGMEAEAYEPALET